MRSINLNVLTPKERARVCQMPPRYFPSGKRMLPSDLNHKAVEMHWLALWECNAEKRQHSLLPADRHH